MVFSAAVFLEAEGPENLRVNLGSPLEKPLLPFFAKFRAHFRWIGAPYRGDFFSDLLGQARRMTPCCPEGLDANAQ